MARRTVRQFFSRGDLVCGCQLRTEILLGCRRLPVHGKYLVARPDIAGRIPVAFQTPFHRQSVLSPHQGHGVDLSMTSDAADSLRDMDAVIEIDVVRQIVDAIPR